MIKPGILSADSRLVLANAIYFKAAWLRPFEVKRTAQEDFFAAPGKSVKAPIMHASIRTGFFKTDSLSGLELTYEDRQLSMVLFLPAKADGLGDLEKLCTSANLKKWLAKLSDHQVDVALPKFMLTSEFQLNTALMALGMKDAFTPQADFSGMSTRDKLLISAVVHKALIDLKGALNNNMPN